MEIFHLPRRSLNSSEDPLGPLFFTSGPINPFNEVIVSWNGFRPQRGIWRISISLYQKKWSPKIRYAEWGPGLQKTFEQDPENSFVRSHQDIVSVKTGYATAFRIEVESIDGADLSSFHMLHVFCSNDTLPQSAPLADLPSFSLKGIFPVSQMSLPHPRSRDLCCPTSMSAAINYLLQKKKADPISFAEQSRDQEFDIFGNWILNNAAAFEWLEGKFETFTARLKDFSSLLEELARKHPVVVSVKGDLPGAPLPYTRGHLIFVIGYEADHQTVLCMDPAFPSDEETLISYPLDPFIRAWGARRNLALCFRRSER